jgi:hypothetical protein
MSRCEVTDDIEIYHKDPNGGNDLSNAQVLCQHCREKTGADGNGLRSFLPKTKEDALKRAGNRCEGEKNGWPPINRETKKHMGEMRGPGRGHG